MANISFRSKFSIIGLGSISTLLVLLMIELFYAQILTNTLIGNISDNLMLFVIILGLLFFTIVVAFIVGFTITKQIALKSVLYSSGLSLIGLLIVLIVVPNLSLFALHRDVYRDVYGFQIVTAQPQVLVLFSILVLGDVFNLFIFTILSYYVIFVIFLDLLYKKKKGEILKC